MKRNDVASDFYRYGASKYGFAYVCIVQIYLFITDCKLPLLAR